MILKGSRPASTPVAVPGLRPVLLPAEGVYLRTEWDEGMMEAYQPAGPQGLEPVLYVTLNFHCCRCSDPVSVTLRCEGQGLQGEGGRQVATLPIRCPACGQGNELHFEPRGRVRGVRPCALRPALPSPSLN